MFFCYFYYFTHFTTLSLDSMHFSIRFLIWSSKSSGWIYPVGGMTPDSLGRLGGTFPHTVADRYKRRAIEKLQVFSS
jgi:hypothetical protein